MKTCQFSEKGFAFIVDTFSNLLMYQESSKYKIRDSQVTTNPKYDFIAVGIARREILLL